MILIVKVCKLVLSIKYYKVIKCIYIYKTGGPKLGIQCTVYIIITVYLHLAHPAYTRWFKYDRDGFVCKQAALRSSCATLRE